MLTLRLLRLQQSYGGGAPLELAADYPDPDVGPLSQSISTMSIRPALPQPPLHQHHHSQSGSYHDTPPQSATSSYSRPLPDPRHASGGYNSAGAPANGPVYDQQGRQWRHSSAGPYPNQGQTHYQQPHNPYGGPGPGEFGGVQSPVGYGGYPSHSAPPDGQPYAHHHSYSDTGHSSDYGQPPQQQQQQLGEFEQLAQQHHHAYSNTPSHAPYPSSTPVPRQQPYYAQTASGPPQPPQPPLPPPSPSNWPQPQTHAGLPLPPQPPQLPAHLLGRSQSVVSLATSYASSYGPPPPVPGSAVSQNHFQPQANGYGPPPDAIYSPAPAPSPYYAAPGPPQPPQPPQPPAPPAGYGAYGAPPPANDYGPPPGMYGELYPQQGHQQQGQGNYLRQQYEAQQQGGGGGGGQNPLPLPPQPPVRPGSGQGGVQQAYNPYAWQG